MNEEYLKELIVRYSSIFMDVVYKDKSFIIDRILEIARRL